MLSVEQFNRDGFHIVKGALDGDEVRAVRRFLQSRIDDEVAAACGEIGCDDPAKLVPHIGRLAQDGGAGLSKATRDTLSGHFSLATRLSEELWRIPRGPRLRSLLQTVLRSADLCMHMPPTSRFVLPGNTYAGVPAHQDISYNRHMSDFVTVWVPFVDIDEACGGVKVYRGSGANVERLAREEKDQFWLKGAPTDGFDPVHCVMQVGDVLLLSRWIVHESMPNRSGRTRISTDFRFFAERERSTKHYLDMQQWKVFAPEAVA
jgi:ectoine hydroxylase-related dioxygenase (phytanoyl-CoA dioxygenase family)